MPASPSPALRVGLTEDHAPTRGVLTANLDSFPDVEVVLSAGSAEEAVDALQAISSERFPAVMLMDIELPGMSGIEAARVLTDLFPGLGVLMLTVFDADEIIFQAIRAGASGYLLKDERPEVIREACQEIARGGAPMSASVARKTLALLRGTERRQTEAQPAAAPPHLLTEREVEILEGLVAGHNYASLAERLFLSPHTVRTHIRNLYRKLHVHSRAEAVQAALRHRLR